MKKNILTIMFLILGIAAYNASGGTLTSHVAAINDKDTKATTSSNTPFILGYYANWDIYSSRIKNASTRYAFSSYETQAKLARLNAVAYAFFGTSTNGTIQSWDYWSDFSTNDKTFCEENKAICYKTGSGDVTGALGNFSTFSHSGNSGITYRLVAVGGAKSFTTSKIIINGYSSNSIDLSKPNGQYNCELGENYKFEEGHTYNLMVNAVYQSCDIKQIN